MILSTYPTHAETPERLLASGGVRSANHESTLFFVRSLSNPKHDHVVRVNGTERCDCNDFQHLNNCAHVIAVRAILRKARAGRSA